MREIWKIDPHMRFIVECGDALENLDRGGAIYEHIQNGGDQVLFQSGCMPQYAFRI